MSGACENLDDRDAVRPFIDIGISDGTDPRRVAAATLDELARVPLLVIEDVHWADEATLDALRVIGRRIDSTRALVVATYRDDEIEGTHPLRVVLGELASAPAVSRLSVPRLSVAAVRRLAAPHAADGDAIHRLTHGNAFYVTEILAVGLRRLCRRRSATRCSRGLAPRRDGAPAARRRRRRSITHRAVAARRRRVGRPRALDACLAAGVLRADGDGVAFRHELARLAVEGDVPPHRRRALHAAIARRPRGKRATSRGSPTTPRRPATPRRCSSTRPRRRGRAAAASAHREASAQYARALRHSGSLPAVESARSPRRAWPGSRAIGANDESIVAGCEAIELYREHRDTLRKATLWARVRAAVRRHRRERRGRGGEPRGDRAARAASART